MSYVVAPLILIGVLITVHELGHFLVAKACGVRVLVFSLGFGPRLVGFTRGETEYRLSAIPLGGYVRMFGDDPTAEVPLAEQRRSFLHQPYWRKMAIAVAGPFANFLLPVLLLFAVVVGTTSEPAPIIGEVVAGDVAAAAGMRPGDRIVAIDATPVLSFLDVQARVERSAGVPLRFTVERDGGALDLTLTPRAAPTPTFLEAGHQSGRIGVMVGAELPVVSVDDDRRVKPLDRVRAVDGVPTPDARALFAALDAAAEREVRIEVETPDPRDPAAPGFVRTVVLTPPPAPSPPALRRFGVLREELAAPALAQRIGETRGRVLEEQALRQRRKGLGRATGLVVGVDEGAVAAELGLRAGVDAIVAVDGKAAYLPSDLHGALMAAPDGVHVVGVIGPGGARVLAFRMLPSPRRELGGTKVFGAALMTAVGDGPEVERHTSVLGALEQASARTVQLTGETLQGLGLLLTGRFGFGSFAGPITIARLSGEAAASGALAFVQWMVFFSVNLAVLNLLPVPVLDGGHVLIFTIEAVTRRRLTVATRIKFIKVGLLIVGAMMLIAVVNDLLGLF
ncbi:MAG: RIP metalloprotease RseP [Deltaproteobacteria bacterium]|nr:RIP metalloprotease RseP [Deltaproteobacteria bacterium]